MSVLLSPWRSDAYLQLCSGTKTNNEGCADLVLNSRALAGNTWAAIAARSRNVGAPNAWNASGAHFTTIPSHLINAGFTIRLQTGSLGLNRLLLFDRCEIMWWGFPKGQRPKEVETMFSGLCRGTCGYNSPVWQAARLNNRRHQTAINIPKIPPKCFSFFFKLITGITSSKLLEHNCHLPENGYSSENCTHRTILLFFLICLFCVGLWWKKHKIFPQLKWKNYHFLSYSFHFLSQLSIASSFWLSLCNCRHTLTSGHGSLEVVLLLWPLESK